MKKVLKWIGIVVIALIVLGFIGAMLGDGTDGATTSDTKPSDTPAVESNETALPVTAQQLFDAYDSNEVAADKQYKGKLLQIDGKVASIDSGLTDSAQVQLATSNDFMSVTATGDEAFDDAAAGLSKNQSISLLCRGEGEIIGSPMVGDCVIQ